MTDKSSCRSVFGKLIDCVNSGLNWNVSQIKSACPPRKKKTEDKSDESRRSHEESRRSHDESKGSLDGGLDVPCPPAKKKSPYNLPSEICPTTAPCCIIKMQDPCAPCCFEEKPKPLPCPPKCGPQEPRQPTCGCDLCQKNPDNEKCCDKNAAFRGITIDPRYFEKA
ncbi:uncharacterized protein LOC128875344 isoform X1 [Hylaeus volcanicus]|uniref:uncharacterized protein LOC128875344 isoform X1 n=1 Tax=Hylaeus volcanicus TaxID=313075 RepID=UPI0023B7CD54|nr:uncharacterized protein LOC128875344 isoform X1 [Hylaeus volcanicus]